MPRLLIALATCLSALLWTSDASACRVARRPVQPLYEAYDAAAFATVRTADERSAEIEIGTILHGAVPIQTAQLTLVSQFGGDCGPGGPAVREGETLVVYFSGQYLTRWARAADVVSLDPYVEAAFLSAFANVDDERKSRLADRAALVAGAKGPVPLSDPALWFAPLEGTLGWTASSLPLSRARFHVNDDGSIGDCVVFVATRRSQRDDSVCETLRRQARFEPPLLSQEREGIYEVRWGDSPP